MKLLLLPIPLVLGAPSHEPTPPPVYLCKFWGPPGFLAFVQEYGSVRPECEYEDNGELNGGECAVENGGLSNYHGFAWHGYTCDVFEYGEYQPTTAEPDTDPSQQDCEVVDEEAACYALEFSESMRCLALSRQNKLRSYHRDTPMMTLNGDLHASADAWSTYLVETHMAQGHPQVEHSSQDSRPGIGENIWFVGQGTPIGAEHLEWTDEDLPEWTEEKRRQFAQWAVLQSVQGWYDEIKDFNWETPNDSNSHGPGPVGHFTAAVWEESTEFGFGWHMIEQDGLLMFYCTGRYAPTGNRINFYDQFVNPVKDYCEFDAATDTTTEAEATTTEEVTTTTEEVVTTTEEETTTTEQPDDSVFAETPVRADNTIRPMYDETKCLYHKMNGFTPGELIYVGDCWDHDRYRWDFNSETGLINNWNRKGIEPHCIQLPEPTNFRRKQQLFLAPCDASNEAQQWISEQGMLKVRGEPRICMMWNLLDRTRMWALPCGEHIFAPLN